MKFGEIIEALQEGKAVYREGWNGKNLFIVKQLPTKVDETIIPKMDSLPQAAKDIIMSRDNKELFYYNQMLIIKPNGIANSWVPSSSDIFAVDWKIVGVDIPDYQYRLLKEKALFSDRLSYIMNTLQCEGFEASVGKTQYELLQEQCKVMTDYIKVLMKRIKDLNI